MEPRFYLTCFFSVLFSLPPLFLVGLCCRGPLLFPERRGKPSCQLTHFFCTLVRIGLNARSTAGHLVGRHLQLYTVSPDKNASISCVHYARLTWPDRYIILYYVLQFRILCISCKTTNQYLFTHLLATGSVMIQGGATPWWLSTMCCSVSLLLKQNNVTRDF